MYVKSHANFAPRLKVDEFLTTNHFCVISRIAKRRTKDEFLRLRISMARMTARYVPLPRRVCSFLETLYTDGRCEVFDTQHLVGKRFIDQGAVGERAEHTVAVFRKAG